MEENKKTRLAEVFLLLFSIAITLIFVEVFFRITQPDKTDFETIFAPDKFGHTNFAPNLDTTYTSRESKRTVKIITNADGFLGKDVSLEKPTNTLRIALLGDSFVEAIQVEPEEKFAHLLEKKLSASIEKNIEVMNFSIGGQGTVEELIRYEHHIKKYNPDIVMLFFFPNDFENNEYYKQYSHLLESDDDTFFSVPQAQGNLNAGRTDIKYRLLKNYRTLQFIDTSFRNNKTLFNIFTKIGVYSKPALSESTDNIRPLFFVYQKPLQKTYTNAYIFTEKLIAKLSKKVHDDGSELWMVYLPHVLEVNDDLWNHIYDNGDYDKYEWDRTTPLQFFEKLANKQERVFLNFSKYIRKYYTNGLQEGELFIKRGDFYDGHLSPIGHQFVSDILVEKIIQEIQ
jgi:hypothetical protein